MTNMLRVHFEVASKIEELENLLNKFLAENTKKIKKLLHVSVTPNPNGDWVAALTYKEKEEKQEEEDEEED
jgi:hypothetical protein